MKIVAIVGSVRKQSFNLSLAKHIQEKYRNLFEAEILTVGHLPFYNQDIELDPPAAVTEFKQKVKDADAILWVTPEYNYSIPGVLKNAIDWLSRVDQVMIGKPSWTMGASGGGMGTIRAQLHLRDILFSVGINSRLLPTNEVYIALAGQKFDAEGKLVDEKTIAQLDKVVDNFMNWMSAQGNR